MTDPEPNAMAHLIAQCDQQDAEIEQIRAIAAGCDPQGRFHIAKEFDERMGALVDEMTIEAPAAVVRGVRV